METDFIASWERWHRDFEIRRGRPHGFLAITSLHWLDEEPERFDDVPGAWSRTVDGVDVVLNPDEQLVVDGDPVIDRYHFANVDERGQSAQFGDALVEVALRDGQFMIRPRHPNHEIRTRYTGTPTYPPSTKWLVPGRLMAYDETRLIGVNATVDGLTQSYTSPGEIEFELGGLVLRLIAFSEEDSDELSFVFSDETSGDTTYAACRFLDTDAPDHDGRVMLDFNRATNPPCAYTDFATCPLPPKENRLPVRVEAGEKVPLGAN